jgi:hypothetical protein
MQFLLELRGELRTSVKYNSLQNTMQENNSGHIQLCQLGIGIGSLDWNEMHYVGEMINNYPY